MISAIQQAFVNPAGLAALLALIPLMIFYLVKPKPSEEVMPSMTFFTEEKRESKLSNALRVLKRNKMLLLHILFVVLAAAAIANPLIPGLESDGTAVIVLDASASMSDNRQDAENFALKHLGDKNTVITVSGTPKIQLRSVSAEKARNFINGYNVKAQGTDLASALQLARNYPGRLVLASDIDHTATQRDISSLLKEIAGERPVKVMKLNHRNSHGFTGLEVSGEKVDITLQNFLDRNRSLELSWRGGSRKVEVEALSAEEVTLKLSSGLHEISLPPDEMALDNKLYVSIPGKQSIKVSVLGKESFYFRKAVELINIAKYSTGFSSGTDIYFVSEEFELDKNARERLEKSDAAKIFEAREGVERFTPVENFTGRSTSQVMVSTGLTARFTSSVNRYDVKGTPLAKPEEAFVLSKDKDVLLYNVEDEKFGKEVVYPVFWKKIFQRMTGLKTAEDLNLQTGRTINFSKPVKKDGETIEGVTKIEETGFYRGKQTYAANLLNPDESSPYINTASSAAGISQKTDKDPSRKYIAALLALIASLELLYLTKRGEIR